MSAVQDLRFLRMFFANVLLSTVECILVTIFLVHMDIKPFLFLVWQQYAFIQNNTNMLEENIKYKSIPSKLTIRK